MKISKSKINISKLYQMFNLSVYNFNLPIQRKTEIWDNERKSLLIHSIVNNLIIPPVYAIKEKRMLHFIDGKQRLTTIFDFLDNKFALDSNTPNFNDYELKNKKFNDLTDEIKNKILNYEIEIVKIEEVTNEEIEDLFFRLNNGVPLKSIETTRAILGNRIIKFIENIANTPFFVKKVSISKKAKQRYIDQELVLQSLMLIYNCDTGFSSKEIKAFAQTLKNTNLRNELMAKIQNTCYYLNEAFLKKERFLKKIHVPMLIKLVYEIQKNSWAITPSEFYNWAVKFFSNLPQEYQLAMLSGSAKKENVKKRFNIISEDFYNYFNEKISLSNINNFKNKEDILEINKNYA